jgi:LysM repeat protein
MKRTVSVALAVTVLALVLFLPASAQTCATPYTVKAGDNLYRIGLAHNVPYRDIAAFNNLANPNLIFVGQVLCIPGPGTPGPTATGPTATATGTAAPTATRTATAVPGPSATPGGATPVPNPTFAIPTFTVIGIQAGQSVTIRTANFPANQTFTALMGPIGSLGVGGTQAGTVNSGAGGTFEATIPIPASMASTSQIALRLQSPAGYYSYGWFYNINFP